MINKSRKVYRVTYERSDAAVTGSWDMSQHFVEIVHCGNVATAWNDSRDEFLRAYARMVSWELIES